MKYMVMECHLSYAVVLDENGSFLKVANMNYRVGDTVSEVTEMREAESHALELRKPNRKWIYSVAATAACLVLMVAALFGLSARPYASVYITINPEVRIDVDRRDTVMGLGGVNADGEALIEGYSYKDKTLDLVMDELIDRAISMGYLHEGGKVSLSFDAKDNEWVVTKSDAIGTHINEHLSGIMSVTIEVNGKSAGDISVKIPSSSDNSSAASSQASSTPAAASNYGDTSYDDGQTDYGNAADDSATDYGSSSEPVVNSAPPSEENNTDYDDQSGASSDDDGDDDDSDTDYGTNYDTNG